MTVKNLSHEPVLLKEVIEFLVGKNTTYFFDGTLGLGGHAEKILSSAPNIKFYIASELDSQHLNFAKKRLAKWNDKLYLNQGNFSELSSMVSQVRKTKGSLSILLDLGVCSNHLDDPCKGFSFVADAPLGMSFDENEEKCKEILNEAPEQELITIFRTYGEEPNAKRIAQKMIEYRQHKKIETTGELKDIIESNVHPKDRKKALARVFQAVRIAVNDELMHLEKVLSQALCIMETGDRVGIISYHSLEDRIVKKFFKLKSKPVTIQTNFSLHEPVSPAELVLLTKKAIKPSTEEIERNPRSRSACFRIAEKI